MGYSLTQEAIRRILTAKTTFIDMSYMGTSDDSYVRYYKQKQDWSDLITVIGGYCIGTTDAAGDTVTAILEHPIGTTVWTMTYTFVGAAGEVWRSFRKELSTSMKKDDFTSVKIKKGNPGNLGYLKHFTLVAFEDTLT